MAETLLLTLAPVLTVEAVEPSLAFFTERLGFEVTAQVPHGDVLGFAMLERDGVTVMLQSRASLADDAPRVVQEAVGAALLFVTVTSIDTIADRLGDAEIVVPRRETFYGMTEIAVREPGGHMVIFAERTAAREPQEPPKP